MPSFHNGQAFLQLGFALFLQRVHGRVALIEVVFLRDLLECFFEAKPKGMVSGEHRVVRLRGKSTSTSAPAPARARVIFLKGNLKVSFEILGKLFNPLLEALYGLDIDAHLGIADFLLQQCLHFSQELIINSLQIPHHVVNSAQCTAEPAFIVFRLCLSLNIFIFTTAFRRRSYCLSATCCCLMRAIKA